MRISTARRIYSCRDSESGSLRNLVPHPNKRLAGSRSSRIFRMLTSRIVGCKPEQTHQTRMRKGGAPKKEWRKRREEHLGDQGVSIVRRASSVDHCRERFNWLLPARIKTTQTNSILAMKKKVRQWNSNVIECCITREFANEIRTLTLNRTLYNKISKSKGWIWTQNCASIVRCK